MNKADIRNLSLGSLALLIAGILLPCITVYPQAGEYTAFIKMFAPKQFEPTSFSILGGIWAMITNNSPVVGVALLLFSIAFPIWKLATFVYFTFQEDAESHHALTVAIKLGKYSMLDVFVLAVLVIAVKGLPGGSRVDLEWGIYFFTASILLSLFVGQKIKINNTDKSH